MLQGQINLRDAVRRDCSVSDPKSGKRYQLGSKLATLLVRSQIVLCRLASLELSHVSHSVCLGTSATVPCALEVCSCPAPHTFHWLTSCFLGHR